MSTINGFGTKFYGWRHFPDGTSTATRWVSFFYIPVVPLARMKLRVLTDFQSENFFPKPAEAPRDSILPLVKSGWFTLEDHYQMVQKLSLSGGEIFKTYVRTFVLMPLAMLWPLSVLFAVGSFGQAHHIFEDMWFIWAFLLLFLAAFANLLAVAIWAIRRSRGMGRLSASEPLDPRASR